MRRKLRLLSTLPRTCVVLVLLCGYAVPAQSGDEADVASAVAEKLAIIRLLKEENFKELESRFAKIAEGIEKNPYLDPIAVRSLTAFFRADPEIVGPLNRWREAYPDSIAPHLALGFYSEHIGWVMRGKRWARLTNAQRFEEMNRFFDAAVESLEVALKINPKIEMAWESLINMAKTRSGQGAVESIFKDAIEHLPASSRIYGAYQEAVAPKWGGLPAQQFALRARMQGLFAGNPAFAWVADMEDRDLAWELYRADRFEEALEKFDALIARRDSIGSRNGRAWALRHLARNQEAVEEFQHLVAMQPDKAAAYVDLARAQKLIPATAADARRNVDVALLLDPYNPSMLVLRADILMQNGKLEVAKRDLDKALFFGGLDDEVRDYRRRYYWAVGDMDAAVLEAEKSAALVPQDATNLLNFAITLQANRDCRAMPVFEMYLQVCRISDECDEGQQQHVTLLINGMKLGCS